MKKLVQVIIVIGLIAFLGLCANKLMNKKQKEIQLKQMNFDFDISQNYSNSLEDYIDFSNQSDEQKQNILNNASLQITDPTYTYPLTSGRYSAYIQYNDHRYFFTITIKDTSAPVFIAREDTIHVPITHVITDYTPFFTVTDESAITMSYQGDIDFYSPGDYEITAIATDSQGNQTTYTQNFTVDWVYTVEEFNQMWYPTPEDEG